MAKEPWIGDLLGYRQIELGPTGATKLPARGKIRLAAGFTATDDAVSGVTTISTDGSAGGGGGGSEISTAAPTDVAPNNIASGGTVAAGAAARDHKHAVVTGSSISIGTVNSSGVLDALSRCDHVHAHGDLPGGSLHAVVVSGGAAGFMSGTDKQALDAAVSKLAGIPVGGGGAPLSDTPPAPVLKQAAHPGVSAQAARIDHKHDVTFGLPTGIGTANVEGDSGALSRANHVHAHGELGGGAMHALAEAGGAAGFMSGADKTKLDGMTGVTLAPSNTATGVLSVGTTNNTGASAEAARKDHTHSHGALGGGTMHAIADTGAAGFMSAAMVQRLNGMGTLGEPNEPSATALGAVSSSGNSPSAARVDHVHTHGAQGGGNQHAIAVAHVSTPVGGVNTTGGSHGFMSADMATKLSGLSATPASSVDTGTTPQALDAGAASAGSGSAASAVNHKHTVSVAAPVAIGTANVEGNANTLARSNHVHAHGDLAGGSLHALATPHTATPVGGLNTTGGLAGFMSPDMATKLAGLSGTPGAPIDFDVVPLNTGALTLSLAHRGKLIACSYTGGATTITIPRDSTLNLPIGFTCTVVHIALAEVAVYIASEVSSGTYGTPARYASTFSDATSSPRGIYAGPFAFQTLVKVAADTWIITGNYAAAA